MASHLEQRPQVVPFPVLVDHVLRRRAVEHFYLVHPLLVRLGIDERVVPPVHDDAQTFSGQFALHPLPTAGEQRHEQRRHRHATHQFHELTYRHEVVAVVFRQCLVSHRTHLAEPRPRVVHDGAEPSWRLVFFQQVIRLGEGSTETYAHETRVHVETFHEHPSQRRISLSVFIRRRCRYGLQLIEQVGRRLWVVCFVMMHYLAIYPFIFSIPYLATTRSSSDVAPLKANASLHPSHSS